MSEQPVDASPEFGVDVARISMTDQQLKLLALDIVAGKVFGSWMIETSQEHMIRSIFTVLGYLDRATLQALQDAEVGHFYEYISQAGPLSVNGYPSFMSMKSINRTDAQSLMDYINILLKQRADFLGVEVAELSTPSQG